MMRSVLVALAALLFFGGAMTAAGPASAEAHWRHYGADHAYASKDAAKRDAANVFRRAGWPPEAVSAMVEEMRTAPPERITLQKDDRLDFMRTGPSGLWRDVVVAFESPRGMLITAPADRWTVTVDGVVYEAILPDVCNNLAGRKSGAPENPCAYVKFYARDADAYASVAALGQPTPAELAECPISWQGPGTGSDGSTFDPDGYRPLRDCVGGPCDWTNVLRAVRLPLHASGSFPVSEGWWVVRVPRRFVETNDLRAVLCLTDDQGRSTMGMGVLRTEYHEVGAGTMLATIWQDEANVRADYRSAGTILWWRWSHQENRQYAGL